jgi:hypothetical protein
MYYTVQGCSTLYHSLEEANKKALEIANRELSKELLVSKDIEVEEAYYDEFTGNVAHSKKIIKSYSLKPINSKEELLDLATNFDFIVSTYVRELFYKEELIP